MSIMGIDWEKWKDQSWSTMWKTALVRLPRAVPLEALKITSAQGPHPFLLQLPLRQTGRTIPLYVFVPNVVYPNIRAQNATSASFTFPCIMDYHGGGFYLGSCLEQAPFCAKLSRELHAVVLGVDYRMAPLDKFPAAIEDADDVCAALLDPQSPGYGTLRTGIADFLHRRWLESLRSDNKRDSGKLDMPPRPEIELDTSRIAFSGASSGGNIALNMGLSVPASLGLPDWPSVIPSTYSSQIPLLLLYPSLDLRQLPSERFRHDRMPPVAEHKRLDIDDHLAATYVSREMAAHPRASPGLVDTRTGLHPKAKILLVLSGIDTLWEQSKIWCEKVESEGRGGDVKITRYEDRKHGWTTLPEIALSATERKTRLEVLDECVRFTRAAWAGHDPVKAVEGGGGEKLAPPPLPPRRATTTTTESGAMMADQDHALAALLDLGFPAHMSQLALQESKGDVEGAVAWLTQHDVNDSQGNDTCQARKAA